MTIHNEQHNENLNSRSPFLSIFALFFFIDLIFLRWVWIHGFNWGFWDWDYQQTLLEVSRLSWIDYGQVPLWNPFIGGGVTLAGNTLNHAWAPCFIPVLLFGTLWGTKLCLLFYLLLAQWGMVLFAAGLGLSRRGTIFSALLYSLGGAFAHHLTHGHFEWIAIAWIPFVLWTIQKNLKQLQRRYIGLGALFYAFIFLDGGPYQFAFASVFFGVYIFLLSIRMKRIRPIILLFVIIFLGASLSAIKLFPVYETVTKYPREIKEDNFYGAPFVPKPVDIIHQAFLDRDQEHKPDAWMPYNLNIGCYVGWLPTVMALLCLGMNFKKRWPQTLCALFFLWIMLGSVLPWSPWIVLNKFPGLSMLRVPSRFNIYVLFWLSLFAGEGLDLLQKPFKSFRWSHVLSTLLIIFIVVDLLWVNGKIFKVAFSIPPLTVNKKSDFKCYSDSPYMNTYKKEIIYNTFFNWHSCAFPAVKENRGVIRNYKTIHFKSFALPFDHPYYQGEAWLMDKKGHIDEIQLTPNKISVKTNGQGHILFFNQNFDKGWIHDGESELKIMNINGLLAVRLPQGVTNITLLYRPKAFFLGAIVSAITAILLLIVSFPRKKRPKNGSVPVVSGST